jgi:hypothetical protein
MIGVNAKTNNTYIHHALKKQWEFKNMHRDMNEILCFVLIQITETGIQNYKKSLQKTHAILFEFIYN